MDGKGISIKQDNLFLGVGKINPQKVWPLEGNLSLHLAPASGNVHGSFIVPDCPIVFRNGLEKAGCCGNVLGRKLDNATQQQNYYNKNSLKIMFFCQVYALHIYSFHIREERG